jgi:hypothetical protein
MLGSKKLGSFGVQCYNGIPSSCILRMWNEKLPSIQNRTGRTRDSETPFQEWNSKPGHPGIEPIPHRLTATLP